MSRHLARDQCIHEQLSAKEAAVCVAECARIHNKSAVMPLARVSLTRAIRVRHFSPQFAARCYPPIIRLDSSPIAIFSASGSTLNAYITPGTVAAGTQGVFGSSKAILFVRLYASGIGISPAVV